MSLLSAIHEIISNHIRYWRQILKLTKENFVMTYKGAALGWAWAVIRPAVTIATYYFAIVVGLRRGGNVGDCPYFLWLVAGIIPWFYISATYNGGASCIRKYSYLVTKIKFPVSLIPTFVCASQLITTAALTLIGILLFALYGRMPTQYLLQLPFYWLLMQLMASSWSLLSGLLSVMSRDVMHLITSANMVLFWTSGIIYNVYGLENKALQRVMLWNPITTIVTGYRDSFIYETWFWQRPYEMRNFAIFYAVLTLAAVLVYRKLQYEIADVL